jgi:hypothetical protein
LGCIASYLQEAFEDHLASIGNGINTLIRQSNARLESNEEYKLRRVDLARASQCELTNVYKDQQRILAAGCVHNSYLLLLLAV